MEIFLYNEVLILTLFESVNWGKQTNSVSPSEDVNRGWYDLLLI